MLYELINPSDPYTFVADEPLVAQAVAIMLGNGKMGLTAEDGTDYQTMFFLMGGQAVEEHLQNIFGGKLSDFIKSHMEQIADALDSVISCGFCSRRLFDEAMKRIDDSVKREEYRVLVHDRNRTSMNDFGTYAWKMAKQLRERMTQKTD